VSVADCTKRDGSKGQRRYRRRSGAAVAVAVAVVVARLRRCPVGGGVRRTASVSRVGHMCTTTWLVSMDCPGKVDTFFWACECRFEGRKSDSVFGKVGR